MKLCRHDNKLEDGKCPICMTERDVIGEICGIKIKGDPTLPIGAWYFEDAKLASLGMYIQKLDDYLRCHRMKLDGLIITRPKAGE